MKLSIQRISLLVLIITSNTFSFLKADDDDIDRRDTIGVSFFHARSDGSNKARESAGMANLITWGFDDCSHGVAWATAEYARSFGQRDIGKYLFFNGTDTMKTGTAMGPGIDIFGENFLVNDDFNGAITAHPFVTNGLIDVNLFWAMDFCCNGLYFLAHVPFVNTQWSVDLKQTVSTTGTVILANHLGNPVDTPAPFNSMIDAWNGQATFLMFNGH